MVFDRIHFSLCNVLAKRARQLASCRSESISSELIRVAVMEFNKGRLRYEVTEPTAPHGHKSLPFTPRDVISSGARNIASRQTYATCLDGGKKFVYDWESMRLVDFWGT
jgi:DNA-directed RNA polymerase subunit K/omega